jgi:hypothetical protein
VPSISCWEIDKIPPIFLFVLFKVKGIFIVVKNVNNIKFAILSVFDVYSHSVKYIQSGMQPLPPFIVRTFSIPNEKLYTP